MPASEPIATAILLLAVGVLLALAALSTRATGRTGLPIALVFLAVGILAGRQFGGIDFDDFGLAYRLGTAALVLILFDGGLNTPSSVLKEGVRPAALLATAGVALTAVLVAVAARALGLGWPAAFLLGAVVSSTDAAAVFSVLRASGLQLKKRVGVTLELESGLNDPMAVILTSTLTAALSEHAPVRWPRLLLEIPIELAVGAAAGIGIGYAARWLLARVRLNVAGLYPVLSVAVALLAFAIPSLLYGSGFLAVYLAALVLGNGPLPYRSGLLRVHDAAAWFGQVGMFLVLGLLVRPRELVAAGVARVGVGVGLWLALVARPVAVALCLLPFGYRAREVVYIGWAGLRGAVPIILATFPVLAGAVEGRHIFTIVFFVAVVNALVPGATLRWVTRRLGLEANRPPAPHAVLEITSTQVLGSEVMSFYIGAASAVSGSSIADLPFPPGAAALLIVRGQELMAPKGATVLAPGDHVYVFSRPEDKPLVLLLFGREETE
jgi:cell volume regulation protein A